MASRTVRILLGASLLSLAGLPPPLLAAGKEQVIQPEIKRREVREAAIDTENFELGAYAGILSIEDFGSNLVYGARAAYHVTEDVFLEAAYATSEGDQTSFERLSGSASILTDNERKLRYYNISFGFNILPGEAFVGSRWAFTSAFYLSGGVGSTDFAGDEMLTWNAGFGYKLLLNDWLSLRLDARDHVFKLDLLGEERTTHNLEFTGGLGIFF
ncbi:MAG TPA: outer membrane beta-barrel domain-containing protein [Gammaproteobacteria bacterium]|nr:outer membrane beta-barrel domain-containing protein [Gammaproteobacteria bacterium]